MGPFPTACKDCPAIKSNNPLECFTCARQVVPRIPAGRCPNCLQVMHNGHCTNSDCADGHNRFGKVYAFGVKGDKLQEAIWAIKDHHDTQAHMAVPLGRILAGFILINKRFFEGYDFLLPMPKHPATAREKGFDQIAEIYTVASPYLEGMFCLEDGAIAPYLIQRKRVPSLRLRSAQERRELVRDAFCLSFDTGVFGGKRVLIFDDVMTSGATLSAAAEPLIRAGASAVDGIVLARSQWRK